jgi:hypothetical protein
MPKNFPIHRPDPGEPDRYQRELDQILRRMRELKKMGVD